MRRSFVRLTVSSVLVCWAVGFAVLVLHVRSVSWTVERAKKDGVFLVHELLAAAPATERKALLQQLSPHFAVGLSLIPIGEVEARLKRRPMPRETLFHLETQARNWYYVAFDDGSEVLAAGPVNPAIPTGTRPIGLFLAVVLLPLIAGFIAIRVERQLTKVERASQALAVGELSARVDNRHGPSNELAASFNMMAARVEQLVRSRDELVQAVSHELGSPLSRLRFHMALMQNQSEEEREQRLSAMNRDLDALDELVAELLSYVQSDELKLDQETFAATRSLTDLAELAQLDASDERTVDVSLQLAEDTVVFADQRLFQRAIENLLRNAIQHAQSRVLVELKEDETSVRVVVHDDGPGIPPQVREKVMVPFFRLEADRPRRTGGVGLGLAIVNRIMHRHAGRVEIGTSPLGGATVATVWPNSRS